MRLMPDLKLTNYFRRTLFNESGLETDSLLYDVRQTLRVTGTTSLFEKLSEQPVVFRETWTALKPILSSTEFEQAADELREEAVDLAARLGHVHAVKPLDLGESRAHHIEASLRLYHYILPKLLLTACLLEREFGLSRPHAIKPLDREIKRIPRGAPARMIALEKIDLPPADRELRQSLEDVRSTLGFNEVPEEFATLALWPDYLQASWKNLKPLIQDAKFPAAANQLRTKAQLLAEPLAISLTVPRKNIEDADESIDAASTQMRAWVQTLPSSVLNIILLGLDWHKPRELRASPFRVETKKSEGVLQ